MLIDELHGDTAAERMTDHGGLADTQFVEEITKPDRKRAQRVVGAGFADWPWPSRSGATIRNFFDSCGITDRQVSELPAIPWISSNASPSPSSR